ncbi:unnamed protein product [Rhizoctonia solani]|uniref:Uncharacterized protein n=2 Tax=Rhizoctonia solani TaxID=456999 RepID=A0A8H3B724_9AGAM|nr:hypothetical protein RSOL_219420 [Rhizoctonia solani AG-3 Rhs1AP]CAE6370103.1 unnamed protein product [Rhizoctonia solani]CAE6449365.1 unnamed protein product [Rhizoctonia solani]
MFFRTFSALFVMTGALAFPLSKRDVGVEKCTKRTSGYLTGAANQKFVISKDGKHVVYVAPGKGGLEVEFQECTPNFTKYPNSGDGPYVGHIYVPKVKKCLHVPSYNETYQLLLEDCYYSEDSGQFAYSFLQKGSNYYWSGATFGDGSLIQGKESGCTEGLYGYQGSGYGSARTEGYAAVACASDSDVKPFQIIKK